MYIYIYTHLYLYIYIVYISYMDYMNYINILIRNYVWLEAEIIGLYRGQNSICCAICVCDWLCVLITRCTDLDRRTPAHTTPEKHQQQQDEERHNHQSTREEEPHRIGTTCIVNETYHWQAQICEKQKAKHKNA